jgi:hypothetical protein
MTPYFNTTDRENAIRIAALKEYDRRTHALVGCHVVRKDQTHGVSGKVLRVFKSPCHGIEDPEGVLLIEQFGQESYEPASAWEIRR